KLECYEAELRRWQKVVNLVAPSTLDEIWHRHFADSAQLTEFIPPDARHLADVGSGGGFPGLVLATVLAESRDIRVTLVESDTRKAAFLRETARRMEIPVEILSTRIESNASVQALIDVDIVVARAFAPLRRLLSLVFPVFSYRTVGVFLKGRDIAHEIDRAREDWAFEVELHESVTDKEGRMAVIRRLARKPEV
ncbi:MAG: 16S rRNA (guanine(527)-N(7))-methyltransferase RsmG, partial [Hyphomicrobiaceae bacterium]